MEEVLEPLLSLHNKEGHSQAVSILRTLLSSLSTICLAEKSRLVSQPSDCPLDDWGRATDLNNLDVKWFMPGRSELLCVESLLDKFLAAEVVRLEEFLDNHQLLDKEGLLRCLKTISGIIVGASSFLHPWQEEAMVNIESQVEQRQRRHEVGQNHELNYLFRGENTRRYLVMLMKKLVEKLLSVREDDTKSLNQIISILKMIMFQHCVSEESVEKHSKSFYQSKSKLEVQLFGSDKHIRTILLDRIVLHHQRRLVENLHQNFTMTHTIILDILVKLATSHYSKVRVQAQTILTRAFKQFPYSYKTILDQVLPLLDKETGASHEEFKGALYIILHNKFLVKHNWELQLRLWPALINAPLSEKPSIVSLIKSISSYVQTVDNWSIKWRPLPEEVTSLASQLCPQVPDKDLIKKNIARIERMSDQNMKLYESLVDKLCDLVQQEDTLHWLHYNTTLTMLCVLHRFDVVFPTRPISIFTNNLLHDNVLVRKASIHVVDTVLYQLKRKHVKMKVSDVIKDKHDSNGDAAMNGDHAEGLIVRPGEREDNKWLMYSSDNKPLDQQSFDEPRFSHKSYFGFYTWPTDPIVYAPLRDQPPLDRSEEEMPKGEQIIFRFFKDSKNVEKLVEYLSLENKKGRDHFDVERFGLFKALFRNFGDSFLENFRHHIEELVKDHRESHQRAASELLAGLIKGSKHWSYEKLESMWTWVLASIRQSLTKVSQTKQFSFQRIETRKYCQVSPETMRDWGTCFATCSDNRDPNRLHWLMEVNY